MRKNTRVINPPASVAALCHFVIFSIGIARALWVEIFIKLRLGITHHQMMCRK